MIKTKVTIDVNPSCFGRWTPQEINEFMGHLTGLLRIKEAADARVKVGDLTSAIQDYTPYCAVPSSPRRMYSCCWRRARLLKTNPRANMTTTDSAKLIRFGCRANKNFYERPWLRPKGRRDERAKRGETMKTLIYGHSDDCIEIEADGPIGEQEFDGYDGARFLHFSDGTVVRCEYTANGVWRIERVKPGIMHATVTHIPGANDDEDNYTDRLTLTTRKPFAWVDCWSSPSGPSDDELRDAIGSATEQADWHHGLKLGELRTIYGIVKRRSWSR